MTKNNQQTGNTKTVLRVIAGFFILLLAACATPLLPQHHPETTFIPQNSSNMAWDSLIDSLPAQKVSQHTSWFSILNTGQESLYRRLALIDTATESIDAQYFLWLEDAVGSLLFERLIRAADRGVRVRLLMDDSFLAGEDSVMLAMDGHPNISVRIFNPFVVRQESMTKRYIENLNAFSRINHRMHNKLMIADEIVAVVGGRNIADEYFGFGEQLNFRDFDVVTAGKIIPELSDGFDVFWNSSWSFPVPEIDHKYKNDESFQQLSNDLRKNASKLDGWQSTALTEKADWSADWQRLAKKMVPGKAYLLLDKPQFEQQQPVQVADKIHEEFSNTREEVIAVTAYLVATEGMLEKIRMQTEKGVQVRFLTNSLASNNHVAAHTAYRRHRKAFLQAGAKLYELRPDGPAREIYEAKGFKAKQFGLHGKIGVLDSDKVLVGTFNLDPRSIFLNTEMGLLIESPELNRQVRENLKANFSTANSWQVKLGEDGTLSWHSNDEILKHQPAGSIGRRIKDFFIGLFPIDSEM